MIGRMYTWLFPPMDPWVVVEKYRNLWVIKSSHPSADEALMVLDALTTPVTGTSLAVMRESEVYAHNHNITRRGAHRDDS